MAEPDDDSSSFQDDTVAIPAASLSDCLPSRYEVLSVLGEGGAGVVYMARDTTLDKIVAVKKLHNSASESQAVRFHREAKVLASLRHRSIMHAIDFGLTSQQEPYLVLDYVKGESLSSWLDKNGPMPVDAALTLFVELADGLAHAHKKGIAHRDIKPSNIMLVDEENSGELTGRLVDFGLAREIEGNQDLTKPGVGIGTPKYMSPEQIQGQEIDTRSDIYSFGCLMFEVLTGTSVFSADTHLEIMNLHLNEAPETVRERLEKLDIETSTGVSAELEEIIGRCLNKDAAMRFSNVEELLAALRQEQGALAERMEELQSPPSEPVPARPRAWRPTARQFVIIVALVLCSAALGLKFIKGSGPASRTASAGTNVFNRRTQSIDVTDSAAASRSIRQASGFMSLKIYEMPGSRVTPSVLKEVAAKGLVTDLTVRSAHMNSLLKGIAIVNTIDRLTLIAGKPEQVLHGLGGIPGIEALKTLELSGFELDEKVFDDLARVDKLMTLKIIDCTGLTSTALHRFGRHDDSSLVLSNTDFADESVPALVRSNIVFLELNEPSTMLTDRGIEKLSELRTLTRLKIENAKNDYTRGLIRLSSKAGLQLTVEPPGIIERGRQAFQTGHADEALACYDKAIELEPDFNLLYISRAKVKGYRGDLDGAIADASRAVNLHPEPYFFEVRSRYLVRKGQYDLALADIERAVAGLGEESLYPSTLLARGKIFLHRKSYSKAVDYFSKAIDRYLDPSFVDDSESCILECYRLRAQTYEKLGKKKEADGDRAELVKLEWRMRKS